MFCTCCSEVADDHPSRVHNNKTTDGSSKRSGNNKQSSAAVDKFLQDLESGETKLPTFNWRFRDGFGSVQVGSVGMARIADSFLSSARHCCTQLELQNQQLGDEGSKELARVLAKDHIITQLNIAKNKIGESGAIAIGVALGSNATLTRLIFDDNPIGSEGIRQLSVGALACTSLTYCDFGVGTGQLVSDDAIVALSELLRKPTLTHFKLSGVDSVSPSALSALMGALPVNGSSRLAELCIQNCVPADAAAAEPTIISNAMNALGKALTSPSSTLTSVELRLPIGDLGAQVLARALPQATNLDNLNVSRCNINASGLAALAKGLATNRSLSKLNVSLQGEQTRSNDQCQTSMMEFCKALESNNTLSELNLADLPMTDGIAERLIEVISRDGCSVKSLRYSAVPSDSLGTRLANLLAEKERQIAQRRRTPPPSAGNTPRKHSVPDEHVMSGVLSLRSASVSEIESSRILSNNHVPEDKLSTVDENDPTQQQQQEQNSSDVQPQSDLEPTQSMAAGEANNTHDHVGARGPNTLAAMIGQQQQQQQQGSAGAMNGNDDNHHYGGDLPHSDDDEMVDIEF